jgi:hypothetical protein
MNELIGISLPSLSGGSATGPSAADAHCAIAGDENSCTPKPADNHNSFATASKRACVVAGSW